VKENMIYRLEKFKFYYYDNEENENVEDVYVLGYFTSYEQLENAINICQNYGIKKEELRFFKFDLKLRDNQKYIYELSYSYSMLDSNMQYVDYSYVFAPQSCKKSCLQLKVDLQKDVKYQSNDKKIFDEETQDGFWIEKLESISCIT